MFASKDTLLTRPSGYTIARSVRLRSSASGYLNRTPATASNRKTWTFSGWVKRGKLSSYQRVMTVTVGSDEHLIFRDSDVFHYYSGNAVISLITTQLFRDPAAWYHLVVAIDTTQATSSNRAKIYVNGVQVTAFSTATYPSQNADTSMNNALPHGIGGPDSSQYFDGYLTEINFIDGQALTPSSFGETDSITGVWKPKAYSGTYGTNGFELNFSDNSNNTAATIGKDYSGNGNNWTPNNISVTSGVTYDSMVDSPTVGEFSSNYCVLNPLNNVTTLSDGNLKGTTASASWIPVIATFGVSSGKWYWEYTVTGNNDVFFGISPSTYTATSGQYIGSSSANGYGYYGANGSKYILGAVGSAYGASVTTNDIVGVALDMNAGTLTFYKNNTSQGVMASSIVGTWMPAMAVYNNNAVINFGQRPFSYTPPTGFVALNTYNLPASTITNGAAYMAATLWTGNSSTQSISNAVNGVSFQPDFVWIKKRSGADDHGEFDSVRGVQKRLQPNLTNAENTETTALSSFDSGGFTLGTNGQFNGSTFTYVGWQWKAGGTAVSNTDGSITSTVSAGATQGFSVVTYTGTGTAATIGHGLGVAPSMIIIKSRPTASSSWIVYHSSISPTNLLTLQTTAAQQNLPLYFNSTSPTSSVFSIGSAANTGVDLNVSSSTYVAYCFAAVAGYSAFGSFSGNGSADGPFVYLGFRPAFLMIKRTNSGDAWFMFDNAREPFNPNDSYILANSSSAEDPNNNTIPIDFVSNGFKNRGTSTGINGNASTYIYMAFAESPFKTSLAR